MPRTREDILEERRQLKAKYRDLFDSTAELLFRHDPVGINFEVNPDEYQAEAGSILPRLHGCQSAEDVCRVVMKNLFGGSMRRLLAHLSDIHKLLLRFGSCGKYLDKLRNRVPAMVGAKSPLHLKPLAVAARPVLRANRRRKLALSPRVPTNLYNVCLTSQPFEN